MGEKPLRNAEGVPVAAWLFLGGEPLIRQPQFVALIKASEARVGACLNVCRRAQRSALVYAARRLLKNRHTWRMRLALGALCLLSAILLLPVPYRVHCKCKVQPVVRRYVTAPFDGTLDKSLAEPGDRVEKGQVLARMDGREVRWEASGYEADRNRAEVNRKTHLAKHDLGPARMAELEAQRLDLKLRLLRYRSDHLDLKSPIRGIVVSGDQKRVEGMPVTVGQALFEVAPLDRMVFELAIPEEEFAHVSAGQTAIVRLDAFPGESWEGALARVDPRAESRDSQQVFVGEWSVKNNDESLRPGMNGMATIVTRRHLLVWNVLHKPWQHFLAWLGW